MRCLAWLLLGATIFFSSCSPSTKVVQSWRDPNTTIEQGHYKKLLCIALVKDETNRRVAEDKLVALMPGRAVQSYSYLGEPAGYARRTQDRGSPGCGWFRRHPDHAPGKEGEGGFLCAGQLSCFLLLTVWLLRLCHALLRGSGLRPYRRVLLHRDQPLRHGEGQAGMERDHQQLGAEQRVTGSWKKSHVLSSRR